MIDLELLDWYTELTIFENRGHAPSIELPDEFNRAHLAFLNVLHDSTAATDRMELNLASLSFAGEAIRSDK